MEDLQKNLKKLNLIIILSLGIKSNLNILSVKSIKSNIDKIKPDCVLHLAGLSRPMDIHDRNINKSIDLNIIGTANLVKMLQ